MTKSPEKDTERHYASDEIVQRINAAGARLSKANYVYYYSEAVEPFYAVLHEVSWVIDAIPTILKIRGVIKFAVVGGSNSPYQVSYLGDELFIILIDAKAFYFLLILTNRIQSLPPLAELLETEQKVLTREYRGMYLLDITKDIVFGTKDVSDLICGNVHRSIYQAAIVYIIGHEIAHIAHGHIEFLKSPQFSEFCTTDDDRYLTLKTLEMDADTSATSCVFDVFERISISLVASSKASKDKIPWLMRRRYIVGAYIALIYMDTLALDYAPKAHPITYVRFLTTLNVFKRIFLSNCPEAIDLPDEVRAALIEVFVRLSGSLANLGHPLATNAVLLDPGSDPVQIYCDVGVMAGLDHLTPLLSRWARVRPHLEAFHRGGKLAPASAVPQ